MYGFIEFLSRWANDGYVADERALLIPNIPYEDAMKLGAKYEQNTIIVKKDNKIVEVCTTPFTNEGRKYSVGDIVRTFNIDGSKPFNIQDAERIFSTRTGGAASKLIKGKGAFQLQEVYSVTNPRPSVFADERKSLIWIRPIE